MGLPNRYSGMYLKTSKTHMVIAVTDDFVETKEGETGNGRRSILHELAHRYVDLAVDEGWRLPTWYFEGVADYYSSYYINEGRAYVGSIQILESRVKNLLRKGMPGYMNVDSKSLFELTYEKTAINSKQRKDLHSEWMPAFYGRSMAVTHYLHSSDELRNQLVGYFLEIKKGNSIEKSFQSAFKVSFSEFDKAVNSYLRSDRLAVRNYPTDFLADLDATKNIKVNELNDQQKIRQLFWRIGVFGSLLGKKNYNKMAAEFYKLQKKIGRYKVSEKVSAAYFSTLILGVNPAQ